MDFVSEKGAARIVNAYIEREMTEYRKVTDGGNEGGTISF